MFQALNAVLSGSSRGLTRSLSRVANAAEDTGEAALQGAVGLGRLEESASDVTTDATQGAAAMSAFQSQLDEVGGDALTGAIALNRYRSAVDDVGDEAAGTALTNGVLSGSLATVGGASSSALAPLGAIRALVGSLGTGSISTAAATSTFAVALDGLGLSAATAAGGILTLESSLLPLLLIIAAVVVAIAGLAAALTGLTVAAGAAAAALSGLLLGGLIPAARELAEKSEDIESTWEGLEVIFGRVRDAALKALEPLIGVEGFEGLAFGALEQSIATLHVAAETAADLGTVLRPLARQFGAVFSAVRPQVFDALEQSVRQFAPMLADVTGGVLRSLPGVFRTLQEAAQELGPDVFNLGESLGGLLPEAISLIVDVTRVVLPLLTFLAETLDLLLSIIAPLVDSLDPLLEAFGQLFDALTFGIRILEAVIDAFGRMIKTFVAGLSGGPLGDLIAWGESFTSLLKEAAQSFIFLANNTDQVGTLLQAIQGDPNAIAQLAAEGLSVEGGPSQLTRTAPGEQQSGSRADGSLVDMSGSTFTGGNRREAKRTADEVERVVEKVLERKRVRESGSK
jgi:hypothetical protein